MYLPAEDTYLLAECALQYRGRWALEIGVGSGAVVRALAENFENVAGSDIDWGSLRHCRAQEPRVMLACCDAASAFCGTFDLIVSNPPYLPDDEKTDATVHGGPSGVETTVRFVQSALPLLAKDGRMLVVVSSLADQSALDSFVKKERLKIKVIKEKALFFERLSVVELTF
ncbi:MAG: methyltransferase [Nitrososphaera sp.]|uniref:methyltransferase n=1 Tax=Nitrososphaera sp. TaxID=1971748 RepID=UPI003D6F35B5